MLGFHALWESVYLKMESEPEDAEAARQRGKLKEDKVCGVCGDRALGYNFDAISCESCKAFFRRNAPKGLEYFKCSYDEKCKMDISNRRFCKRCRLKKCFDIGMRKEYILTEEERMRKRQKIEENRAFRDDRLERKGHMSPPLMTLEPLGTIDRKKENARKQREVEKSNGSYSAREHSSDSMSSSSEYAMSGSSPPQTVSLLLPPQYALSLEEVALIDELIRSYRSSLDICVDTLRPRDQSKTALPDLVNVAEVSIRRVIDMAKKIRCFKQLPQPTQITLLKGGSIELLIIRSVLTYDKEKQLFLDARDNPQTSSMTLDEFKSAATKGGMGGLAGGGGVDGMTGGMAAGLSAKQGYSLVEDVMRFVRILAVELCADETVLILLLVISLFSPDRPNLDLKETVAHEQERYSMLLLRYLESKYSPAAARAIYPKLLMKLTDIRNLNEESSQVFLNMNADTIQPLMKEVLDLQPNATGGTAAGEKQPTPAALRVSASS